MSFRTKRAWLALVVGVAAVAAIAGGSSNAASSPVIIGVSAPITGPGASGGVPQVRGALLAVAEYNKRGGYKGRPVKLNTLDDQGNPQTGLAIVQKFVNNSDVIAILGSFYSNVAVAVNPLVQQSQVSYISDCSTDACTLPPANGGKNYMFRCSFSQTAQILAMLNYLKKPSVKPAILYELSGFGIPAQQTTVKRSGPANVKITASEGVEVGALSMTSQLAKLRDSGANTIVAWMLPAGLLNLQKNLQTINWHPTVVTSYAAAATSFIQAAGSLANGMLVANAYQPGGTAASRAFDVRFKAKFGENSYPIISALYYDATRLVLQALGRVGTDPKAIRDELQRINSFKAITSMPKGPWRRNHDAIQPAQVFLSVVMDGKLVPLPK
jgi:branched-chain amino acid transport system substrate-binding protein